MRPQISLLIFQGKVPLVIAHHGDQDFTRQVEEASIKTPQHRVRPLRGIGDPVGKPIVLNYFTADIGHNRLCRRDDPFLTVVIVNITRASESLLM